MALKSDKELKQEFKKEASKNPDKYYATDVLKKEGFMRKQCKCGIYFWTVNPGQDHCGDPVCSGGFKHFVENPAKVRLNYIEVWTTFKRMFEKLTYKAIDRYPVIARWNPSADFTMASIAAFQPYVISGEVEPPAKKLVIPQFCLRFGDVDNVGVTGAHNTGFVMIGQHAFVTPEEWDQDLFFQHMLDYILKEIGIPKEELTLHEDAWAGGGNFGPCMEFFSRGIELFNQVYMMFEQTEEGNKELDIKVLDMGLGMERIAWFSQGTPTIYDATFPTVIEKLREKTGMVMDEELFARFAPHAALLNIEEIESREKAWEDVSRIIKMNTEKLKKKILPMTAIFSIAEHTRALLVAISDGGLPSNVGGGYNLRVILRRALSFIDQFKWDIDLSEVAKWHAEYLQPLFPELLDNIKQVKEILDVEKKKYEATKEKAKLIVENILEKATEITEKDLLELYDSHGIAPEMIKEQAEKIGKAVVIPEDFYKKITELHEQKKQVTATHKEIEIDIGDLPDTKGLYFKDYKDTEFDARLLKIVDNKYVILDQTSFYPVSGGQLHDEGTIGGCKVLNVFKQGSHIIHEVEKIDFKEGDKLHGSVDFNRRKQLTQHHTSAHIINAAARMRLGNHIFQAGAAKFLDKARLDITHYDNLSPDEIKEIEDIANRIVQDNLPVYKRFMPRKLAEAEYGMRLYQGGAVPGKSIRIVEIPKIDIEACGGTHLNLTSEAGNIKILKTTKIQDGIVRLEFAAGNASEKVIMTEDRVINDVAKELGVDDIHIVERAKELFAKWKKARKAVKKKKKIDLSELKLKELKIVDTDILDQTAAALSTQPEHALNTIRRFKRELEEFKENIKGID